ncbi:unnamed protein product, partial [Ectocarpus sp. 6 AP-2014]
GVRSTLIEFSALFYLGVYFRVLRFGDENSRLVSGLSRWLVASDRVLIGPASWAVPGRESRAQFYRTRLGQSFLQEHCGCLVVDSRLYPAIRLQERSHRTLGWHRRSGK